MEIERKWLAKEPPSCYREYKSADIAQGYISTEPVIRVRKAGERHVLTVKGDGTLSREEFEMDISSGTFSRLLEKCGGMLIRKTRYFIPLDYKGTILPPGEAGRFTAELDIFREAYEGLIYVEVEFESVEEAWGFRAPDWFGREVTGLPGYSNAELSLGRGGKITQGR